MLIKISLLFLGFIIGYFYCCLTTIASMNSVREEAEEYIEYMRKTYEEMYKND